MDVVYPVRYGDRNPELRYSLRTLVANFPHDRVWIVGYQPNWVGGVGYIKGNPTGDKQTNLYRNIQLACAHPEVSEDFILFNDDFFVTEPVDGVDMCVWGSLTTHSNQQYLRNRRNWWALALLRTAKALREDGCDDPLSYEVHVPMPVNKAAMAEALEHFDIKGRMVCLPRSVYGNYHRLGGREIRDPKDNNSAVVNRPLHSTQDTTWHKVSHWFAASYATPCCYEKEDHMVAPTRRVPQPRPGKALTATPSLEWMRQNAPQVPPGQAIVELGVFQGGSLAALCEGAAEGVPVYGVDGWGIAAVYADRPRMRQTYNANNMRIAARTAPKATLVRALTTDAAQTYDGPPIGLLYVDAEHRYRAVLNDVAAWLPHLAPNALVVFDDYLEPKFVEVVAAVDYLVATGMLDWVEKVGNNFAVTRLPLSSPGRAA